MLSAYVLEIYETFMNEMMSEICFKISEWSGCRKWVGCKGNQIGQHTWAHGLLHVRLLCLKFPTIKRFKITSREVNNRFYKKSKHITENTQMANKHLNRCTTFIIIKEMQIQLGNILHLKLGKNDKSDSAQCWQGHRKQIYS